MLELVGDRIPDEREVGLVGLEHVLDQRVVGRLPVEALLDVGLLAHDACLEHGEVGRGRRRERWATNSAKSPVKPGSPGHDGHVAMARVTDVWNRRTCEASGVSVSTLTSIPAVEAGERPSDDGHLDIGQLALGDVGHRVRAVLAACEQNPVRSSSCHRRCCRTRRRRGRTCRRRSREPAYGSRKRGAARDGGTFDHPVAAARSTWSYWRPKEVMRAGPVGWRDEVGRHLDRTGTRGSRRSGPRSCRCARRPIPSGSPACWPRRLDHDLGSTCAAGG